MADPIFCHYEVVDGRGPYTTVGNYIQQNKAVYIGEVSSSPLQKLEITVYGHDVVLWHIRGSEANEVLTRSNGAFRITPLGIILLSPEEHVVAIKSTNGFLKPGDGFEFCPIGYPCVPGKVDWFDYRPRPTVKS